VSAKR
jgi:hypothetical protein